MSLFHRHHWAEEIVAELVAEEWYFNDRDGWWECIFCGGMDQHHQYPNPIRILHEDGCLWVRAKRWADLWSVKP